MAPPTKRNMPVLTVTVDADTKDRIVLLAKKVPGGSISGIVRELVRGTLPMMEAAVEIMHTSMREDGSLDEAGAKERMGAWIGTQLLTLYDTQRKLGIGEESTT